MIYTKLPNKNDISEMVEIESCSHENPWNENAFIVELSKFNSGKALFYIAKDDSTDEVAGYIMGDLIVDYIHISNVAVSEKFRGKGVARELLAKLEFQAKKQGYSSSTLEVRENNESAINLYKRAGYEVKGRREKYYSNKYDALLMWKNL